MTEILVIFFYLNSWSNYTLTFSYSIIKSFLVASYSSVTLVAKIVVHIWSAPEIATIVSNVDFRGGQEPLSIWMIKLLSWTTIINKRYEISKQRNMWNPLGFLIVLFCCQCFVHLQHHQNNRKIKEKIFTMVIVTMVNLLLRNVLVNLNFLKNSS